MLEISHVSVSCGGMDILSDISVTFPKENITTIVGPNGCGKTTLLQTLNGTFKVTAGKIYLDDRDYMAIRPKERARNLSFMPQVRTNIPCISVQSLVEHGRFPYLGLARKKNAKDVEIVGKAMDFTGVSKYATQSVDTLSGGIRQRVFLAMQLAQDCDYMVLDETTTYLDLPGQRKMLSLIQELKKQKKTLILVLHDLNQALSVSDYIVVMKERKIVTVDTPGNLTANHVLEEVFDCNMRPVELPDKTQYLFW